jgi:hypothetical protein
MFEKLFWGILHEKYPVAPLEGIGTFLSRNYISHIFRAQFAQAIGTLFVKIG